MYNYKADGAIGWGIAFAIVGDHENRPTDMTNLVVIGNKRQDMKLKIILMDQGGAIMDWNENGICGTLRSQMGGHPPVVVLEDDNNDRKEIF